MKNSKNILIGGPNPGEFADSYGSGDPPGGGDMLHQSLDSDTSGPDDPPGNHGDFNADEPEGGGDMSLKEAKEANEEGATGRSLLIGGFLIAGLLLWGLFKKK